MKKESSNPNPYTFVMPYTPTVYELYRNYLEKLESHKNDFGDSEFMKIETLMFGSQLITEDELYKKYRLAAFKNLKKVGLQILQNTYSPEKTDRIVLRVMIFLLKLTENVNLFQGTSLHGSDISNFGE